MDIKQIKSDIEYLNRKFTEIAGIWEFNNGDYLICGDLAELELEIVKNISKRYPNFNYTYNEKNFKDNDYSDEQFSLNSFLNNNINEFNYNKADIVAFNYQQCLLRYLKSLLKEEEYSEAYNKLLEKDKNYLRYILNDLKDSLSFDNNSEEWILNGYKPLTEYIFEETYTILNPKELIYEIQKIIENEMKLNF